MIRAMTSWVMRSTFVLGLILTLLFGLGTSLVHVLALDQRYFDGLRAFLLPPDHCPAPCFLGIRPGVTTRKEALALLQAQPSVKNVRDNGATISWEWDSGAPYVQAAYNAWLALSKGDLVYTISVEGTVEFGDVWIALGIPDRERIGAVVQPLSHPSDKLMIFTMAYDAPQLTLITFQYCPVDELWRTPVRMMWATPASGIEDANRTNPSSALLRDLNRQLGC
jgi:hypothetical protein